MVCYLSGLLHSLLVAPVHSVWAWSSFFVVNMHVGPTRMIKSSLAHQFGTRGFRPARVECHLKPIMGAF